MLIRSEASNAPESTVIISYHHLSIKMVTRCWIVSWLAWSGPGILNWGIVSIVSWGDCPAPWITPTLHVRSGEQSYIVREADFASTASLSESMPKYGTCGSRTRGTITMSELNLLPGCDLWQYFVTISYLSTYPAGNPHSNKPETEPVMSLRDYKQTHLFLVIYVLHKWVHVQNFSS